MHNIYSLLAMPAWLTENAKWIAVGRRPCRDYRLCGLSRAFQVELGRAVWTGACALFSCWKRNTPIPS
ncbi:MAG: hypothetical protein ACLS4Z_10870 [Christensenellaceae bacterium]